MDASSFGRVLARLQKLIGHVRDLGRGPLKLLSEPLAPLSEGLVAGAGAASGGSRVGYQTRMLGRRVRV